MIPILLQSLLIAAAIAIPLSEQQPLGGELLSQPYRPENGPARSSKGLKGRFLHVTGMCALDLLTRNTDGSFSPRFPPRRTLQGWNVD